LTADFACKTINPEDTGGPKVDAVFPGYLTSKSFNVTPVNYWNLIAAKYVLENVKRIFTGVREYNEGGWCYTGRPEEWYIREQVIVPFPEQPVFAVYLNPKMRVYEWRAEYAAEDDHFCPVQWQNRYRGLVWKSIS